MAFNFMKIVIVVFFLVLFNQALAQQCRNGEIRLVRNSTPFEGGIDVCVGSVWGTVCNDFWGLNEVRVACRQLGFQVSGHESFIDLIIEGGPDILIDNINCTGSEQNLTDCMFSPEVSDCLGNFTHKVGVRCHEERPPQSVHVTVSEADLSVIWEEPLSGVINDPVMGYNIECSTSTMTDSSIQYKARGTVPNTTTSIVIPLENLQSNVASIYNCCVEVEYETYSSIACTSARRAQVPTTTSLTSEISTIMISEQLVAESKTSTVIIGGVLGAIIVILTLSLVLSLAGLFCMYRRVKIAQNDRAITEQAKSRVSESDEAERVVENPTYGVNDTQHQTTYEGVEQYSRTGPDYEPIERDVDPIEENYTLLEKATVPYIEYASDKD